MSSLFLRAKSVWISFTDRLQRRQRFPTGYKVARVRRDARGRYLWPAAVIDFQKKFDANAILGKWEFAGKAAGTPVFSEVYKEFLELHGSRRKTKTQKGYKLAVDQFLQHVGDFPVGGYDESMLLRFRGQQLRQYSDHSAARVITVIRTIFRWAVDSGYIDRSPVTRRVLVTPDPTPIITYSDSELKALFDWMEVENIDAWRQLRFLLLTGFRSGESCSLTWDRVHFDDKMLQHWNEKKKRWEAYPMDETIAELLLMTPRKDEPFVFHYRHVTSLSHLVDDALEELGIEGKKGVHTLKKNYVRDLVRAGLSEVEIHRLAHHRSIDTTLKYYAEFDLGKLRSALHKSRRKVTKNVTVLSHSTLTKSAKLQTADKD